MGSYINKIDGKVLGASAYEKVNALVEAGATAVKDTNDNNDPIEFSENLVVVVDNGHFGAAAYAYSENEYKAFLTSPHDRRLRFWLTFDRVKDFAEPKYWE